MTTSGNLSRRRFLQATGGAATAAALAGCGGDEGETATTTADTGTTDATSSGGDVGENTFSMINSSVSTFDPVAFVDEASGYVIQQLFETLTDYPNGEVDVETLLATDYEVSDDGRTYTFHLAEDATYSTGDPVTAGDFVYAWERLAASPNSNRAGFLLDNLGVEHETTTATTDDGRDVERYVPESMAVTAVDEHTLEVTLAQPNFAALRILAYRGFAAIPEGIVGDIDGYEGELSQSAFATENPVGSGPFTLDAWRRSVSIDLAARDDYWGDGPEVDGVHMQVLERTSARYTYATLNMNADNPYVPPSKWDASKRTIEGTDERGRRYGEYGPLENGLTVPYYAVDELSTYWLAFNCQNVPKPVRQAVSYAVSQQTVVSELFKDRYNPAHTLTPPGLFPGGPDAQSAFAAEHYPYGVDTETRLDEARRVMADAGYGDSEAFELTLTLYQGDTYRQLGTLVRDLLSSAHMDVTIEQPQQSTMLTRLRNGDVDVVSSGWSADYPAATNFLQLVNPPFTRTNDPSATSYYDWFGTAAAERAANAWDRVQDNLGPSEAAAETRSEAYRTMERAWMEDAVIVPLFFSVAHHMDYPWLEKERTGAMGSSNMRFDELSVGDRSQYR
ncbi:ABC transporter substrate-binding protein [Halarchaeum sp. CBA1220]|uniref:ABC transporter substrate-binding protein n=1 Tax=Halarchaeum sp. CBA1220 TaxID=1853682 RepID=UPI000F3A8196|nr:ABC transporter substrate-binding protein [Halarchaeum sp. CBA1220]QLC34667.1 ABC transporter substrate-binding protein [Halarchaeum sp. CBA1220]